MKNEEFITLSTQGLQIFLIFKTDLIKAVNIQIAFLSGFTLYIDIMEDFLIRRLLLGRETNDAEPVLGLLVDVLYEFTSNVANHLKSFYIQPFKHEIFESGIFFPIFQREDKKRFLEGCVIYGNFHDSWHH